MNEMVSQIPGKSDCDSQFQTGTGFTRITTNFLTTDGHGSRHGGTDENPNGEIRRPKEIRMAKREYGDEIRVAAFCSWVKYIITIDRALGDAFGRIGRFFGCFWVLLLPDRTQPACDRRGFFSSVAA
jgi:hypothetical protein